MLLEVCIESDGKLGGSLEMRLQLSMYHHLILFLVVPPTKLAVHVHACVCGGGSTSVITLYCTTSQDHIEVPLVITSVSYVCR